MWTRLIGALLATLLASGCAAGPTPSPVRLPADAPLGLGECGWSADVTLAFAGWADLGQLGLPDTFGPANSTERVFAIVSTGHLEQHPMQGPSIVGRGACVRGADGRLSVGAVPDDWQPPTP